MKSILSRLAVHLALLPACQRTYGNFVTIAFDAQALFTFDGTIAPENSLFLLVADTGKNGFDTALPGSLAVGSFIAGDDQILGRGFTETLEGVTAGTGLTSSIELESGIFSQLDAGDPLAVLWFPTLSSDAFNLVAGTSYGIFTTLLPVSDHAWQIPVNGTIDLYETRLVNDIGAFSGRALHTVAATAIPEPSTYAALLGLAVLGLAAYRRRRA